MEAVHIDSSEVTVDVGDAKVVLEGVVPDRRMKHAIEDLVDACPGVQDIDNRVRVASASVLGGGSFGTPTGMRSAVSQSPAGSGAPPPAAAGNAATTTTATTNAGKSK
jgi:hypothetical protein